jgi:YNFM family putative membrane transporter
MARISLALFMAGFATFSLIYSAQPLLPEFTAEFGVDPATSSLALRSRQVVWPYPFFA